MLGSISGVSDNWLKVMRAGELIPVPGSGKTAVRSPMDGCPVHALRKKLQKVRLRPTRQRIALGWLLFGKGHRHVTAEMLLDEASRVKSPVSMATIYNTLNQFTQAGLLREIAVEGSKAYYDTNPTPHSHFLIEEDGTLMDIPDANYRLENPPTAPDGYVIHRVELVVRIRRSK